MEPTDRVSFVVGFLLLHMRVRVYVWRNHPSKRLLGIFGGRPTVDCATLGSNQHMFRGIIRGFVDSFSFQAAAFRTTHKKDCPQTTKTLEYTHLFGVWFRGSIPPNQLQPRVFDAPHRNTTLGGGEGRHTGRRVGNSRVVHHTSSHLPTNTRWVCPNTSLVHETKQRLLPWTITLVQYMCDKPRVSFHSGLGRANNPASTPKRGVSFFCGFPAKPFPQNLRRSYPHAHRKRSVIILVKERERKAFAQKPRFVQTPNEEEEEEEEVNQTTRQRNARYRERKRETCRFCHRESEKEQLFHQKRGSSKPQAKKKKK